MSLKENEITKPAQLVSNPRESEDCTFIDAEDYKADDEFPVPMFVQHTQSILEEIDQMVVALTPHFYSKYYVLNFGVH